MAAQTIDQTYTDTTQGTSLRSSLVQLLVDNKVVAHLTTPATFPNHLFVADFGNVLLGGACTACATNTCTPGKFTAELGDQSLAKIELGKSGPDGEPMELQLDPSHLVDGAAEEASFDYYGMGTSPVEAIGTVGSGHRQYASPNGLTDIVDNSTGGIHTNTEIKTYQQTGTKSGGFYPGANLVKTIRFEHSFAPVSGQPPESAGTDTTTITEIDDSGTKTTTSTYDRATKIRTLVTDAGQRKESRADAVSGSTRTVTDEVSAADHTLLQKVIDTYTTYGWGEALTSSVSDPDGSARTTTWTYDTNAADGGYGQPTAMVDPDGYWERYTYYPDGRKDEVISQYDGAAVGASEADSRVVTTTYDGDNRTEIETLLGQEVARRYILRTTSGAVTTERDEICTVPGAAAGASTNLTTTTVYRTDGSDTTRPDGTMNKVTTTPVSGGGQTVTTQTGAATTGTITDGTTTVVQQDPRGNEAQRSVTDVATSTLLLQDTATATDAYGRPTTISHLNGTSESKTYGCCGIDQWTDIEGVTTTYGRDDFGNVSSETRAGLTLARQYDALGRLRLLTRTGSDSTPITVGGSDYNLGGRETLRHSILGDTTITDTTAGGNIWTHTETGPGGGTHLRTQTSDGLLLGIAGTAEHPLTYAYGVSSGQCFVKETRIGDAGATTEWVQQNSDAAGRVVRQAYPDGAHADLSYNALGQLASQTDPDGVVTLLGYDSRGNQTTTTLDVNRNGVIDVGEPSTTTTTGVTSGKLRTTITTAGDSGPVTVSLSDLDPASLNRTVTNYGQITSTAVTVGSGTRTETSTLPDFSTDTRTFTNGQLTSDVLSGGGATAHSISYQYDARSRLWKTTDARTGTATTTYYDNDLVDTVSKAGQTTTYTYNAAGQLTGEALPGSRTVTRGYQPSGELTSVSGNAEYPVTYTYDPQGRMETMVTATGTTTWQYDSQRGWLNSKKDAALKTTGFTHTVAGRTQTRTWARGAVTTYGYDNGGRLHTITYSDSTPSVTYGYNARNEVSSVVDAAGTHTLAYAGNGALSSDSIASGPLGGFTETDSFDSLLRPAGFQATKATSTIASYGWGYDGLSRLQTVTSGSNTATYAYLANSALAHTLTSASSGTTQVTTTTEFDNLDRLQSNISVPSAADSSGVTYTYNTAGERELATRPDGSYWSYGYNNRGELTSGTKQLDDSEVISGFDFAYTFDNIGNRTATNRNERGSTYTPNTVNEYSSRTVPGYVDVIGQASELDDVLIDGNMAPRQGGYFDVELSLSNSPDAAYHEASILAENNADYFQSSEDFFVPATPENYTYDDDGNLLSDGHWNYTWDAENRLISMVAQTQAGTAGAPLQRITFAYDYAGRRISKEVENWQSGAYVESSTTLFAYDGWNLAAEWSSDGGGSLIRNYAWGRDLSGGNAAGGVGGLLFIKDLADATTFSVAYDGNGNVTNLYNMSDGSLAANYEYGPFGELLYASGDFAGDNPIRWSTKYEDDETGLAYYGNRYYDAGLGRWLSRDPIEEDGGINLYGFVDNNPTGQFDPAGLQMSDSQGRGAMAFYQINPPGLSPQQAALYNVAVLGGLFGEATLPLLGSDATIAGLIALARVNPTMAALAVRLATAAGLATRFGSALNGDTSCSAVAAEETVAAKTVGVETKAIAPYFPSNNGFIGATERQFLMPGQQIDRYGGSSFSRFFSPAGTPEAARALPAASAGQPLRTFEVLKPFEVDAGTVAPAFGQPGFGTQFVTPVKLEILLKRGIIRELTP